MDFNAQFQRAFAAFNAGRHDAARTDLLAMTRAAPRTAQAWHLLALVERKRGDASAARAAFDAARRLTPDDPTLLSNHANFLGAEGEAQAALALYRRAVALKPDFADAWLNLGLTAQGVGDMATAARALARANALAPNNPKGWSALGLLLRAQGELTAAAGALDTALRLDPRHAMALSARAQVEAESGGSAVAALFARARAAAPADKALVLAEANAFAAADAKAAGAALAAAVAAEPLWADGHLALAKLRWQQGDGAQATVALDAAIKTHPTDRGLWHARLVLARRIVDGETFIGITAAAEAAIGPNAMVSQMAADARLEMGDLAGAMAKLAPLKPTSDVLITRARLHLRGGDPAAAAAVLMPMVAREPDNQLAWALLATAWRLDGDARGDWLLGHERLWGRFDLGLGADELASIADHVRALHTLRVEPVDQSLRGGTQTTGALFLRTSPAIVRLRRAIEAAIQTYIGALPAAIVGHPLLGRERRDWRFTGSWSVRLTGGGFHVAHVHPQGWISSACYLALPDSMGGAGDAGWLALGEPPAELMLALPSLAMIEPRVGTLALFPSFLWHGTRPFNAGERLSVAFDVAAA